MPAMFSREWRNRRVCDFIRCGRTVGCLVSGVTGCGESG